MKRAYLATLTITLLANTSAYAAINCATPPTCAELGYTDTVANCSGDSIKCPFDTSVGKCLSAGATVGQIGYFPYTVNDPKWIKCDGRYLHKDGYPELYEKITHTFGGVDNLFKVPDYSGDFVRVYGRDAGSLTSRQTEGLPNIYGHFGMNSKTNADGILFYKTTQTANFEGIGNGDYTNNAIRFDASKYNPIYGASSHVTPVNTAVNAYIYAGKIDESKSSIRDLPKDCSEGYFYYLDGTCSLIRNISKGLKGFVMSASTTSTHSRVTYITGGNNYANSYEQAKSKCRLLCNDGKLADPASVARRIADRITTTVNEVAPISTSRQYWNTYGTIHACTSTALCNANGAAASGQNYYYYCECQDSFY